MSLPAMQAKFVDEYLIDHNQKQAAIRAGYSPRSAEMQASRLMRNAKVQAAIGEKRAKQQKTVGINQAWVLERLVREAEFTGQGSSHSARVTALGLAMRHLGMLKEDAPHPDREKPYDLSKLTDDAKQLLISGLQAL